MNVVLTYEDYVELPNDGRRYEILDGELNVTAAPNRRHQGVLLRLATAVHTHVRVGGLGEIYVAPFDVILAETSVVQPDIVHVARDRLGIFSHRGADGAPTLVIEILSPSTSRIDRTTKFQLYARYAVPYYWMVDPAQPLIEAYRWSAAAYELAATLGRDDTRELPPFDGLGLDASSLWFE